MSVQRVGLGQGLKEVLHTWTDIEIDGLLEKIADVAETSLSDLSDAPPPCELSHTEVEEDYSLLLSEDEPEQEQLAETFFSKPERIGEECDRSFKMERRIAFLERRERLNRLRLKRLIIQKEILLERERIRIVEREMELLASASIPSVEDQQESICRIIDRVSNFASNCISGVVQMAQLSISLAWSDRLFA